MGLGKTIQTIAVCEVNWGGPVLVVAPAMLLNNWIEELNATVPRRRVYDYRNQARDPKSRQQIENYDYVLASYNAVEREFAKGRLFARHQELRMEGKEFETIEPTKRQIMAGGPDSKTKHIPLEHVPPHTPLHAIQWYRVVCDEAHNLKSNGKTTNAVCALLRQHGIYITGTPQQNGYKDWFAAFRFARIEPFWNNEALFKQYFVNKTKSSINKYEKLEDDRGRILSLMIRGFSLRRQVTDKFNGEIPLKEITVVHHPIVWVDPDDGSKFPHHPKSEKSCQETLKHHWKQGGFVQTEKTEDKPEIRRHILAEMTVATQATVHPAIPEAPKFSGKKGNEKSKVHVAYQKWLQGFERDPSQKRWRSSVILALLKIIRNHVKAMKRGEPGSGGGIIVFARYRPILDLINIAVSHEIGDGVGCIQFDGRLDDEQRDENLKRFKAQASLSDLVFLATPKMLAEGFNLFQASCIALVTPHFNPFVDIQAMCRAIRPGQTRPVHIWRIAMNDSFDVRIDFVQDRKIKNAEGITEWDKKQLKAVTEAEGWTEDYFYQEASTGQNL
jgi:SNF2 family DNA or RNA helicase